MQGAKAIHNVDEDTIRLLDIVQFIKASYKQISLFGLCGLFAAISLTYMLGQHTSTIMLLNNAELNIPRIKYLQAALPKLSQEERVKGSESYLSSEMLWMSAIRVKNLVGKSDAKDILDPASLQTDRFNIYAIEVLGKANTKRLAEDRVKEISNYFISGTIFIELRDLIRKYEFNINDNNAKLGTKILNAEVELAYIDRRIKSLTELEKKYPDRVASQITLSQLADAKDGSSIKYLPIWMQIIAAKVDQNNQQDLLLRLREEASKIRVFSSFVEKARPLIEVGHNDPKLITELLNILAQAAKEEITYYQKAALSTIEGDIKQIAAFKLYGLPQAGSIRTTGPAYLKNATIGLLGGAIIGILTALGLVVVQRLRAEAKLPK
jgi:hypothetical protein